jgi:hypothetical protein
VRGFLWFNHAKEADWRVQSSDASRIAYATAVAASRYVSGVTWILRPTPARNCSRAAG